MADSNIMNQSVDEFIESTGIGSQNKALTNTVYGFNHTRMSPGISYSKSTYGWTFFTRPQLNLRDVNLRRVRTMMPLLSQDPLSIYRYVRTMLDPRLMHELYIHGDVSEYYSSNILQCPLVDPKNAFIPLLTNSIKSISGWPDEVVPNWTSSQGDRREQFSMVDGIYEINEAYDLNITFENYVNDPVFLLFQTWIRYSSLVFEGMMVPYLDFILEDEIDYNTRIYRITTDATWEYLNYISATGAAYPVSVPQGKMFDMSKEKPYSEATKEINIRFKAIGAIYNDDILVKEFNETNAIFNPEYRSFLKGDTNAMVAIPKELRTFLNHRGYPYINPDNYKIEWLIPKNGTLYKKLFKRFSIATDTELEKLITGV